MKNWTLIERVVAGAVFVYALILYLLTVAPTASFWDAGEFIAIANQLQVSHPPGAPFYMLIGRLFSMFVPVEYIALSVNLVSVLASAFTILLTHLIIVRLVREWQGAPDTWTVGDRVAALVGGVVGACTFAVTDSFWFNAVEAEVYAMSMLFTALVVWLILIWRERAQAEEALLRGGQHPFGLASNRYLILIAYLFGLAIGIHLLNLLAIFFIALIFFYTEIEKAEWSLAQRWGFTVLAGGIASLGFLLIYPGIITTLPSLAEASGNPGLFLIALVGVVAFLVYYTHRQQWQVANLVMVSVTVVLIGYSSYALIFIRSAADPPIDENDPETAEAIVSYLKREQYGSTPLLKGHTYNDRLGRVPDDVAQNERLKVTFPRRHSPDPNHARIYRQYTSDWEFFWEYQIGHMYVRYFMWNFVGKASDVQDAQWITGFKPKDDALLFQTPSERASRNFYFALPLLLGLMGALYHFMRDWRRGFAVFVLFFITGIGIILYLNQPPLQPRERDYSYVASFFAFSLWVGLGATGILELIRDAMRDAAKPAVLLAVGAVLFAAVPGWMLVQNYDDHDRSGRYVAPDYAYNMLMSVDDEAVLFTNGDNDTFPLWYLQEIEGVRRDVRVANLSLLNTPWYVRQLKYQASRDSPPLPITMDDARIADLRIIPWEEQVVQLPVDQQAFLQDSEMDFALEDTSLLESPMTWTLTGRPYSEQFNLLYAADQVVLDMLITNARNDWERPIYFAVTVSPSGQLNLQNYFQLEGQAYRVVPLRHEERFLGRPAMGITPERLRQFRFRNLADPDVYYDENIRRMVDNYRNIFAHTADAMVAHGQQEEAKDLLHWFHEQVPFSTIPGDERSYMLMARAFQNVGDTTQVKAILEESEPALTHLLQTVQTSQEMRYASQYFSMARLTYIETGDFEAAADFSNRLAAAIGDTTTRTTAEDMERLYEQMQGGR